MADEIKPDLPDVAVPENAVVGDENIEVREPSVDVNTESVPAQVTGPAVVPVDTVKVHETFVAMDEVITDPSSPLAVQIPDAGRGSLDLPIHGLSRPRPEDVFAEHAASIQEREGDAPTAADPNPDAE